MSPLVIITCVLSLLLIALTWFLLVRPLRLPTWGKWVALGIICLAACKIQILYIIGGRESYFTPDLPPAIVIGASWLWLIIFFNAPLLLIESILLVALRFGIPAFRRLEAGKWQRAGNRARLWLLMLVAIGVSLGMRNSLLLPEVENITITLPNLPAGTPPVRLALLADLHADSIADEHFMQGVVERTNAEKPDIIAIAGDFVDGTPEQYGKHLAPLRGLRAPMGVFGVEGNHDVYSDYTAWLPLFNAMGIQMLHNEGVLLHGGTLWFAGVFDKAEHFIGYDDPIQARRNAPKNCAKILLAHQPATFAQQNYHGYDLQLSGHTHGGMMPGLRYLIGLANKGYVAGLYQEGERQLYVSRGTRLWSGWLFRLFNPAEITIITLQAPKA